MTGARPERELVDREQARACHERTSDRHHLLLPARRPSGGALAELLQRRQESVDTIKPFADLGLPAEVTQRRRDDLEAEDPSVRPEQEIRLDGQSREHMPSLRHLTHSAPNDCRRRRAGEVVAVDTNTTFCRPDDAAGRVENGRLAGTVRTDQRNPLTRADVQRDPVDRHCLAVADDEVLELEKRQSVADPR